MTLPRCFSTLYAMTSFMMLSACIAGNPDTPTASGTVPHSHASPTVPSPERYTRFYCHNDQTLFSSGISAAPRLNELSAAATGGDAARIKDLIDSGVNVKDSDDICYFGSNGFVCRPTPLALAVRSGNMEAVKLLLTAGANVDAGISVARQKLAGSTLGQLCISRIGTPLSSATGDYVVYAGPRYLQGEGLRWSLQRRFRLQTQLVEVLLMAGANPNFLNRTGNAPSDVELLIIDPLSDVARLGNVDAVNVLLDYGAEINSSFSTKTPLRWAIHWSRIEVINTLLRRGADPNTKDTQGLTDLQYAYEENDSHVLPNIGGFLYQIGSMLTDYEYTCRREHD